MNIVAAIDTTHSGMNSRKVNVTTQAMIVQQNVEARSRNHCCRGKAITITYWVDVCNLSYPARNAHVPYYIVVCGLVGSAAFFYIIS
jgi:hypothetical protein